MATWESRRVSDVVQDIHSGRIVLPVIQRSLVWNEAKMELLFDSLLKGNSFGGIMVLQESQDKVPLFAFRRFSREGEELASVPVTKLAQNTLLVIDGQQRLQSFYMGLQGGINDKRLYLNLLGQGDEFEFRFAYQEADLPEEEPDDDGAATLKLWYPVPALYDRLHMVGSDRKVVNEIASDVGITDGAVKDVIEDNVQAFFLSIFLWQAIGLSSVIVDKSQPQHERQRIVELFRRLNDGGTRLSSFDLAASMYKGFDFRMETFFRDVREFADIGISQDEVIKLVFLLQDSHTKEVTDIEETDAKFVVKKRDRIVQALRATRAFLKNARLYDYYAGSGRSVIPLYFVAYHVFHKSESDAELAKVYDNFDAKNDDFLSLKRWMYLSVLDGVFSRGVGWIPYRTGIRKILNTLKAYKDQTFPSEALFEVYRRHPLTFSTEIAPERLDLWDRDFVFYLMYDCQPLSGRDIDHVHPKSRLDAANVEPHKIHSIANFQLLDEETNRKDKRAKTLAIWLHGDGTTKGVSDLSGYLTRHLIPEEESTWEIDEFDAFLAQRASMICECVQQAMPRAVAQPEPVIVAPPAVTGRSTASASRPAHPSLPREALLDDLPPDERNEPILDDKTPWIDVYRQAGYHAVWAGRYANGLASLGIDTVGNLALCVMARGVEIAHMDGERPVLKFHEPISPGAQAMVTSFGGWGWHTTLHHLREKGLDWQDYVVTPEQVIVEIKARNERTKALYAQLSPEQQTHPILDDTTSWEAIYRSKVDQRWASRYRDQLAHAGIKTVGDMAVAILALGLEFSYARQWGNVFCLARPGPDDKRVEFETYSFGPYAWTVTLDELEKRGFDWKEHLVNRQELEEKGTK